MPGKAEFLGTPKGWTGDARLYRVIPSARFKRYFDSRVRRSQFVVVSAIHGETYIFPSDRRGNCKNWSELPGSFQGDHDHKRALAQGGWVLL